MANKLFAIGICLLLLAPLALAEEETQEKGFFAKIFGFFRGESETTVQEKPVRDGREPAIGRAVEPPTEAPEEPPETYPDRPSQDSAPGQAGGVRPIEVPADSIIACNPCNVVVCGGKEYDSDLFVCPEGLRACMSRYDNCRQLSCLKPPVCKAKVHRCYDYRDAKPMPMPTPSVPVQDYDEETMEVAVHDLDTTTISNVPKRPAGIRCEGSYEECVEKYGMCECGYDDYCEYKGKKYEVGEIFNDNCNKCECGKGGLVACTEKACAECKTDRDCPQIVCVRAPCPQQVCVGGRCIYESKCGNGICEEGEASWCPQYDCKDGELCPKAPCYSGTCPRDCGTTCPDIWAPVCGQPPMPPCPDGFACAQVMPAPQTYSNECTLKAARAEFLHEGQCKTDALTR